MKNSTKKQFINFKLCIILSAITVSLHPSQDVSQLFVQYLHVVYAPRPLVTLGTLSVIRLVIRETESHSYNFY